MNPLIFALSGCTVIVFFISVWLNAKSGKCWVENL